MLLVAASTMAPNPKSSRLEKRPGSSVRRRTYARLMSRMSPNETRIRRQTKAVESIIGQDCQIVTEGRRVALHSGQATSRARGSDTKERATAKTTEATANHPTSSDVSLRAQQDQVHEQDDQRSAHQAECRHEIPGQQ